MTPDYRLSLVQLAGQLRILRPWTTQAQSPLTETSWHNVWPRRSRSTTYSPTFSRVSVCGLRRSFGGVDVSELGPGTRPRPVALDLELVRLFHLPDLEKDDSGNYLLRCWGLRTSAVHTGEQNCGRVGSGWRRRTASPAGVAADVGARRADPATRFISPGFGGCRQCRRRCSLSGVLLTYLDESYTTERYLIAALIVPDAQARSLTAALDKVVEDAGLARPGQH